YGEMKMQYDIVSLPFKLRKQDGTLISGRVFRPDDDNSTFPAVIFSHGFGSCYSELMHHGSTFAQNGIICIFVDLCGGGPDSESDKDMQDMTLETEVDDLIHVINHAILMPYVDTKKLYLIGESMGGMVSAMVARRLRSMIKGLILWYPAFVVVDDAKERIKQGITEVMGISISKQFDSIAASLDLNDIQSGYLKPVLIIHGDKDEIVPIRYSEMAKNTYPDASLITIRDAGHGFEGDDSDMARNESIAFILRNEG
ncbi:MAG: alpha/beta fold hydrolase, partial [Lachnospiraceae bacterium]|nr:alpha/beta fold hydrolase [Lachnospiraceae bacterium]